VLLWVKLKSRNLIIFISSKNNTQYASYLLTVLIYLLTHSKEHSPSWEASLFSASQEFPYILLKPNVHSHIHKHPSPLPNLSHLHPGHAPTSHFLKIHLNNIIPSTLESSKWNLTLCFPHRNMYTSLQSSYTLNAPQNLLFSILLAEIYGWRIWFIKHLIMYFFQSHAISFPQGQNILQIIINY